MLIQYLLVSMHSSASLLIDVRSHVLTLTFAWASAIALRAVRTDCARSTNVALGTLGPRNERREENSPNTSAEATNPSGPRVSLNALTDRLSRNFFVGLG